MKCSECYHFVYSRPDAEFGICTRYPEPRDMHQRAVCGEFICKDGPDFRTSIISALQRIEQELENIKDKL